MICLEAFRSTLMRLTSMDKKAKRSMVGTGVLAIVLAVSLLAMWWVAVRPLRLASTTPPRVPAMPEPEVTRPKGLSKSEFYRRDLEPLLNDATSRNQQSAEHALIRLHQEFEKFRAGIPGFADDVTSWGMRWRASIGMLKDTWKNYWKSRDDPESEEVKKTMRERFEARIMSRDGMTIAMQGAMDQFGEDVTASRNRLLMEAKLALSTKDMQLAFPLPDFDAFQRQLNEYMAENLQVHAADSIANALVTFVASGVAGWAAEQLMARIITLLTEEAMLAGVEAATVGGGTTAGGGGMGGAGGWVGGPGGAGIGIGGGLTVGAVVVWWVTE